MAPATRIGLDVVPLVARPDDIDKALDKAVELRDRARQADTDAAGAVAELERLEAADREAAAAAARAGESFGGIPPAVKKARAEVDEAQRVAGVLRLAADQAGDELAIVIRASADTWGTGLDKATEDARAHARKALEALEQALQDMGNAAGARAWIDGAITDGRFDRPVPTVMLGATAPTSRRMTANGEALRRSDLLRFVAELLDPAARPVLAAARQPDPMA
jgi:hypothetical protein